MADIFQEFLGFSHAQRVTMGKSAAAEIVKQCADSGAEDKAIVIFLCNLTRLFVSVDRNCTQGEYELFVDVTGFDIQPQEFFNLTNNGADPEFVQYMLETVACFSEDGKKACCIFGLCICSADGEVTEAEKQMIARTLG